MPSIQHSQDATLPRMPLASPSVPMSVGLITEVQDALMMASTDLKRLEGLLDHATANLFERFGSANHALAQLVDNDNDNDNAALKLIRNDLHQAVTELQFHDMATQLLVHTGKILQGCAWKLADSAMEPDEDEIPLEIDLIPERPSPVTQSEMDAGSIDLF
jgi:hypothetical protein